MECPICGNSTGVVNGALCPGNKYIRRRKCKRCDFAFTTEEKISEDPFSTTVLHRVKDMKRK